MTDQQFTVQLLLTGSEIMSGDTIDSNSARIAQRLAELGLSVQRKVALGDKQALLVKELSAMSREADLVIVNGGLGPTVDDLTAQVLAEVAGVPIVEHSGAMDHLRRWCAQRNAELNQANYQQALLPAGVTLIDNPTGSAVGFELKVNGCRIICTPGVPSELSAMLDSIMARLDAELVRPNRTQILRLQTFGLGESRAQQMITDAYPDWPAEVELGFRAGAPQMEIKLTIENHAGQSTLARCRRQLDQLFGDHIVGEGDAQLASTVIDLLRQRGQTLSTAESCTGGLIASMLTRIPGSSEAFHAGFITYDNHIKSSVLGVSEQDLIEQGAVSETVVRQMALGAMQQASADYAIAVSGVAGPGGGSPDKPVGTVWLAWGSESELHSLELYWPAERGLFQTMLAAAGLDMIRRQLLGISQQPHYFSKRQRQQTGAA